MFFCSYFLYLYVKPSIKINRHILTHISSSSSSPPGSHGHVPPGRGGYQRLPPHGRGAVYIRGAELLRPGQDLHGRGAPVPPRPQPHHQGVPGALHLQCHAILSPRKRPPAHTQTHIFSMCQDRKSVV